MELIICPCNEFRTVQDIHNALYSEDRTRVLMNWLGSSKKYMYDDSGCFRRLSCQTTPNEQRRCACLYRTSSAISVLNAIRDACRPYVLTQPSNAASLDNNISDNMRIGTPEKPTKLPVTYEESFPSLGSSTMTASSNPMKLLAEREKDKAQLKAQIKPKRRIRLEPASSATFSGWGLSVPSKGNISSLPSENPFIVPNSTLLSKPIIPTETKQIANKTATRITPMSLTAVPSENNAMWHTRSTNRFTSSLAPAKIKSHQFAVKVDAASDEPSLLTEQTVASVSAEDNNSRIKLAVRTNVMTEIIDKGTAGVTSSAVSNEKKGAQLQRLIEVYSIILKQHLVPSTALELHLLIRLLTVPKDYHNDANDKNTMPFSSLFLSGKSCQEFAIGVLNRLRCVLKSLGFDMVTALAECPPFQELLPEAAEELRSIVDSQWEASLLLDMDNQSSIRGNNKTPMLTLPFDQNRDSRHNYRSREEAGIYKNREESRDAFLYQLRAFQNVRGRVLDAVQAERYLQKIQSASKEVVQGIFPTNMIWFAQMFCELLLQIGLVPMEETDKEILNITDKDKLQKLHRRFSSKEGKTSKSSQKLVLESKSQIGGSSSSLSQPQQFFPGHQEFFFIFVQSADSYNLGIQLKHHLVGMLSKLASTCETKGLEQRLLNLQLIGKFLGMLVFSPNWQITTQGTLAFNNFDDTPSLDGHRDADAMESVLPLVRYVEDAWKKRKLVAVIPWMVEFLRMLQWDRSSQGCPYYRDLFSLLLGVHEQIEYEEEENACGIIQSNVQLVSFYLETLFSDVIGFGRTSALHAAALPKQDAWSAKDDIAVQLDASPLVFSKSLLFGSNPYMEELFVLISAMKDTPKKMAIGISPRKMRPYSIRGDLNDTLSASFNMTETTTTSEGFGNSDQAIDSDQVAIQRKLVDAFFHQHQDLKDISWFVVDHTLKNVTTVLREQCIIPVLDKGLQDIDSGNMEASDLGFTKARMGIERQALIEARKFLKETLERTVSESLVLLGPSSLPKRVIEIATSLAVVHGTQLGENLTEVMVRTESKKKRDAHARLEKRQLFASNSKKEEAVEAKDEDGMLSTTINSFDLLADALIEERWELEEEMTNLVALIYNAKGCALAWFSSYDQCRQNQSSYGLTSKLDPCGPCFVFAIKSCLRIGNVAGWSIIRELLELAVVLAETSLSHRVLKNLAKFFRRAGDLEDLIKVGLQTNTSANSLEALGKLLINIVVKAKLINETQLKEGLTLSLSEQDSWSVLSRYCLNKLNEKSADDSVPSLLIRE